MTWLIVAYVAIAWIVLVAGLDVAHRPSDVARAVVEAALWPAIIVLAHVGALVDMLRTIRRPARVRAGRTL